MAKVQLQDMYHGAALTQIVEDSSFKALNKGSRAYGHYMINHDRHMFVKYASGTDPWQFSFSKGDLQNLIQAGHPSNVFAVLVCSDHSVCGLSLQEFQQVADTDSPVGQWIRISSPPRRSLKVSGPQGKISIPHNRFPGVLLG